MTELSSSLNAVSSGTFDFFEAVYAPGTYGSGKEDNRISYTSAADPNGQPLKDFSLYSVKVVMYGTSTVDVPKIAQLRVLALPSYSAT
jgi:hypothetical protein